MHNLIDREVLKRDVRDVVFAVADTPLSNDAMSKLVFQMGELLAKKIDDAPGVDAEPVRHGRWIHTTKEDSDWGGTFHRYTCTACNWSMGDNPTGWGLFCPNCGAKMDGDMDA